MSRLLYARIPRSKVNQAFFSNDHFTNDHFTKHSVRQISVHLQSTNVHWLTKLAKLFKFTPPTLLQHNSSPVESCLMFSNYQILRNPSELTRFKNGPIVLQLLKSPPLIITKLLQSYRSHLKTLINLVIYFDKNNRYPPCTFCQRLSKKTIAPKSSKNALLHTLDDSKYLFNRKIRSNSYYGY